MARRFSFYMLSVLLCASAMAYAQGGVKNRITQQIDGSQLTRLRGNVHPLIRTGTDLGRLGAATQLRGVSLVFGPSAAQKPELDSLIAQQHDPNSPLYHKWITPDEYANRFSLSPADVAKVSDWLKGQGFTIDRVSRSRNRIAFSGTVAQIESVFKTEFHRYNVDGEQHFANATELSVPAAITPGMIGFRGLDNFRWKPRAKLNPRTNLQGGRTALMPADVTTIYDLQPLYNAGFDGTGQRIAVVGQTSISVSDVTSFRSIAGLPANPPQLVLIPGATSVLNTGDEVEADLDVEWAGGIAKNATIIYVYADQSNASGGVVGALAYAIDQNIAPVISMSYGACEAANGQSFIDFLNTAADQADTQGQTIVSSSGDNGAADCESSTATVATHGLAVDVPAAIAKVTGIGGTTFTGDDNKNPTYWAPSNNPLNLQSAIKYIPETTWNDSDTSGLSGTGGGVSSITAKPSFQTALTPNDGHRDVPDVALSASPNHDPYLICNAGSCAGSTPSFLLLGGTSAGAPVFAGILTLINHATENSGGQGTINATLYTLAGNASIYATAFHDVTSGNNKVTCQGGSTGCVQANSHVVVAEAKSPLARYAALLLLPLCGVVVLAGRRRSAVVLGMIAAVSLVSIQLACGGGSSTPPPPPPPANLQIGWSAGTGYDLVTGLGSVDAALLAAAPWPGFTTTPAYNLTSPGAITMTTSTPGSQTITVTRTDNNFTGTIDLSCIVIDPHPAATQTSTCTVNPQQVTLGAGGTTSLVVHASVAGSYTVSVTGFDPVSGRTHSVNVPVTVN